MKLTIKAIGSLLVVNNKKIEAGSKVFLHRRSGRIQAIISRFIDLATFETTNNTGIGSIKDIVFEAFRDTDSQLSGDLGLYSREANKLASIPDEVEPIGTRTLTIDFQHNIFSLNGSRFAIGSSITHFSASKNKTETGQIKSIGKTGTVRFLSTMGNIVESHLAILAENFLNQQGLFKVQTSNYIPVTNGILERDKSSLTSPIILKTKKGKVSKAKK